MANFVDWMRKKISAPSKTPSGTRPHTLTPAAPADEPPTRIRESDGLPVGSTPVHQLPTSLQDMSQDDEDDEETTASVWSQVFCGRGNVKTPRVRSARELEAKRMKGIGHSAALEHIYGDKDLKPPINKPTAKVNWAAMAGLQ
jgi:hypothetical protein